MVALGVSSSTSGDGYGDGYGAGDGAGYGYGYGSGDGSGDGDGSGSGDGSGDGYGYGYGDGDGYGAGSGYGAGEREAYAAALLAPYAAQSGGRVAWWRSDADGCSANGGGGSGTPAHLGVVEEVAGPLELCTDRALHATTAPWAWRGKRLWIVALYGEVQERDENKLGALKREILAEVRPNPWA